jgi:MinD-like ATPase involved in chromosome partitioning or flagellar assembly
MGRIISIHSFRGGTGKSNITANLAVLVAQEGHRVGIVDTDIQSPGIHVLFDLDVEKIKHPLNDYLWGKCSIEEAAVDLSPSVLVQKETRTAEPGAVYLIPSSNKTSEITRILREGYDVGTLNDGFRDLISALKLDFLFIDTHPGLNEETLLSIAISDILILILRPDKQDFQGTAVTVEVARKLQVPNLLLIVNKVLPDFDFEDVKHQVESTYQAPVVGLLPLSLEMVRLASGGIFSLKNPEHPISKEIAKIAASIIGGEPARS